MNIEEKLNRLISNRGYNEAFKQVVFRIAIKTKLGTLTDNDVKLYNLIKKL